MEFKDYQSRPIIRRACEITPDLTLTYWPDKSEAMISNKHSDEKLVFACHEEPFHGDFVIYLTETDIYHCKRSVFEERNII